MGDAPFTPARGANAFHHLQQHVQVLTTQIQSLSNDNRLLQQYQLGHAQGSAQAAGAPPAPSARSGATMRIDAPPKFDGVSAQLEGWIRAVMQQFDYFGPAMASDAVRIAAAQALMRGAALTWWDSFEAAARPTTWGALTAAMRAEYQTLELDVLARGRLNVLRQGSSQVDRFVAAFRGIVIHLPTMAEADKLWAFKNGLSPWIRTHLDVNGVKNLADAIAMALRVGMYVTPHAPSSAHASSSSSAPMDLSNIEGLDQDTGMAQADDDEPITKGQYRQLMQAQAAVQLAAMQQRGGAKASSAGAARGWAPRGLPKISWLTDEEVKAYMAAAKCFGCESKDHRWPACPRRTVDAKTGHVTRSSK